MNPTIYKITNPSDARLQAGHHGDSLEFLRGSIKEFGQLYGTVIPGAGGVTYFPDGRVDREVQPFWEYPVFVCPRCQHATKEDEEDQDEWYCKYCHSHFFTLDGDSLIERAWSEEK